jgi:aryl-alcohol dehydrogenase-like predicted oxidoreductase
MSPTIERIPFGSTGHASSRVLFGAAALGFMREERTGALLDVLLEYGVNHIDTAAAYGDSELRLAPWLRGHRDDFFLATKTGERGAQGARESLERSLERLGVDRVDLIQLHNLVDPDEWERALGPGGALEALVLARDAGLVRFIGVTGHGWNAPEMHRKSLERFPFDSVLLPYNFTMLAQAPYAESVETLMALCEARGVAVQTIKSVARRRWRDGPERRFSWYEPVSDADAVARAVRFVLERSGLFLNSSSDARLLRPSLEAALVPTPAPSAEELAGDVAAHAMEPLFAPGQDAI